MQPIKNVIYDLGGVLVGLDIERCRAAFRSLGLEKIAQIINPYHPAEMIGRLEHGDISFHEACGQMRQLTDRPDVTDAQIAWAYGEFLTGVPIEKIRQIEALRAKGIRTYVLSNNNPSSMYLIRQMFTADGRTMDDYFDKIYLSYEMHELKPTQAIFRKMIVDSGMIPEESLYIDDSPSNVNAAREAGFAVYMPSLEEDFGHLFADLLQ